MGFPNRAFIVAPLARDLYAETGVPVARIPGATNGVSQLWDTLDQDAFVALNDPTLSGYASLQTMPNAVRKYVIQFQTYDSALATNPTGMKRWIDCTALDFIAVKNSGIPSVKAVTTLVNGDHPQEWDLLHRWAGNVAETLGTP